jgi:broad specificity phosphatase PhoE
MAKSAPARNRRAPYNSNVVVERAVLIVDNQPLRERHFAEAKKVIEKIEKLEDRIRTFHSSDQKRFDQWFDLTFRPQRQEQEDARAQYHELARFHNWVVATAHKLDIEMPQAYLLMKEEQKRWEAGNEEERKTIDHERERREAYIRQEFRSRYNENFSFEEDSDSDQSSNGGIEGLEQILDRLEDMVFESERHSDSPAQERIDRLMSMDDGDLVKALDDQDVAFMMFDVALNWGQTHHDYSFFQRLWGLMSPKQRTFFAYVYNSVTDEPIEEFLISLGLSPDFEDDSVNEKESDEDLQDEEDAFSFDDQYIDPRRTRRESTSRRTPEDEEKLKQTFRKLMRKLHPDVHASESRDGQTPAWVQRIWALVQNAYNAKNVTSLERLLKLTLIRMNVLDELSVGEISEARHWLKRDLEVLEEESSELKTSMAWGFSQKKNFTSLTQRILRQLGAELRQITDQIDELEGQHRTLEMLALRSASRTRSQRPSSERGRPSNRSRTGRSGSGRGRTGRSRRQQEFSFED